MVMYPVKIGTLISSNHHVWNLSRFLPLGVIPVDLRDFLEMCVQLIQVSVYGSYEEKPLDFDETEM